MSDINKAFITTIIIQVKKNTLFLLKKKNEIKCLN